MEGRCSGTGNGEAAAVGRGAACAAMKLTWSTHFMLFHLRFGPLEGLAYLLDYQPHDLFSHWQCRSQRPII